MNREVTIDGKDVDINTSDIPSIIFNNPVFVDLSEIKANRTTTYKLPLTANNSRVIKALQEVNADTDFARKYHVLEESRDGLPVIINGRAKVVSTNPGESLNMSVTWGALKSIADELGSVNINELEEVFTSWSLATPFVTEGINNDVGILYFRTVIDVPSGSEDVQKNVTYKFPSMRADKVLSLIFNRISSRVVFDEAILRDFRRLWIPCLGNRAKNTYVDENATIFKYKNNDAVQLSWSPPFQDYVYVPEVEEIQYGETTFIQETSSGQKYISMTPGKYHLELDISYSYPRQKNLPLYLTFTWYNGVGREIRTHVMQINSFGSIYNDISSVDIEVTTPESAGSEEGRSKLFMYLSHIPFENTVSPDNFIDFDITTGEPPIIDFTVKSWIREDGTVFGNEYPVTTNLPQMSAIEFIKNMIFINGLYATVNQLGQTVLKRIDDLLLDIPNAKDLEPFILTPRPETMMFTYSDYAKVNTYSYQEDETQNNPSNGSIVINDETLQDTKEIIKLAFAPTDDDGVATIPLYQWNVDDETGIISVDYIGSNVQPRIITAYTPAISGSKFTGTFTEDMKFENILNDRYQLMQQVLYDPKVIEISMLMDTATLYSFNDTDIFYFWGYYWVHIQTTANGDNTAKSQFIRLATKN